MLHATIAGKECNKEMVLLLLLFGADMNAVDNVGTFIFRPSLYHHMYDRMVIHHCSLP